MNRPPVTCPRHGIPLVRTNTRFGPRWDCPDKGCTVACWNGSTSTPADAETRDARKRFHAAFDPLWKRGPGPFESVPRAARRRHAYAWLAEQMGIPVHLVHGGYFTRAQCEAAMSHIETLAVQSK